MHVIYRYLLSLIHQFLSVQIHIIHNFKVRKHSQYATGHELRRL